MSDKNGYRRAYGQFFTPEPVVACCYALLSGRLPPTPRIADPACGDGAFLRYAVARGLAAPHDVSGCDVDPALAGALAGAGLPGVRSADGLDPASLPAAAFDVVVGNPPFGIATTAHAARPPASEVRFLLRALDLARPGGYVALVLPSGVLANQRLQALRAELIARRTLLAVIDLPRTTFRHAGASVACSILLLHNAPASPGHQVFFALARDPRDLPALVSAYQSQAQVSTADVAEKFTGAARSAVEQPGASECYWLPQDHALAQRIDAHFWRPGFRLSLERLAARHDVYSLGELLGRGGLIAGDHVRPSRGESRGAGRPYEYYQTREFMAAGYNYAAIERCDERAYRRLAYTAVHQHDILVSCAGVGGAGRGRVCLITHQPGPSCTGDVFILRGGRFDPLFLFLFLGSRGGRDQLLRLQNGVGTSNLSADELLQVQIPLAPAATRQLFAARYTPALAAHDAAMAARNGGDAAGFARARARSEALLADLRRDMDYVLLGKVEYNSLTEF